MKDFNTKWWLKLALVAFALFLAVHYWPSLEGFLGVLGAAFSPLVLGLCIAYPLNILMSFYERHFFPRSRNEALVRMRAGLCLMLAVVTLLAILALVFWLVLPQLGECFQMLLAEAPAAVEKVNAWLLERGLAVSDWIENIVAQQGYDLQTWLERIVTSAISFVAGAVASLVSSMTEIFLGIIFAMFILMGKRRLGRQFSLLMERYLNERWLARVRTVLDTLNDCFHRYIVGQCTEAVLLGGLCALGMTLLRLPHALMIGALIAFTALIPVVGAFIGGAVGAFLLLMESPAQALIFLIFLIVLQQLEGNLIYPHVVGTSIQLPGIWVLAAVTVGGGVGGVVGMLAGVPCAACLYRLLKNDVYAHMQERKQGTETRDAAESQRQKA